MSTKHGRNRDGFNNMTILNFVRNHEDPCVTATEIADEFSVTNEAVHYRLNQLKEKEKIQDKYVGASAKVWYTKS